MIDVSGHSIAIRNSSLENEDSAEQYQIRRALQNNPIGKHRHARSFGANTGEIS
jgi:hypothetical protein